MKIAEAKRIFETARNEDIAEDLILDLEGLNREEYRQALKLYLKTLPNPEITMGYEEGEPDQYYCIRMWRIPSWFE